MRHSPVIDVPVAEVESADSDSTSASDRGSRGQERTSRPRSEPPLRQTISIRLAANEAQRPSRNARRSIFSPQGSYLHQSTTVPSPRIRLWYSELYLRRERMGRARLLVHCDSEAGCVGNLPVTIDHADRSFNHLAVPRHGAHHLLLDHVIRSRNREVQCRDPRDGTRAGYAEQLRWWQSRPSLQFS